MWLQPQLDVLRGHVGNQHVWVPAQTTQATHVCTARCTRHTTCTRQTGVVSGLKAAALLHCTAPALARTEMSPAQTQGAAHALALLRAVSTAACMCSSRATLLPLCHPPTPQMWREATFEVLNSVPPCVDDPVAPNSHAHTPSLSALLHMITAQRPNPPCPPLTACTAWLAPPALLLSALTPGPRAHGPAGPRWLLHLLRLLCAAPTGTRGVGGPLASLVL